MFTKSLQIGFIGIIVSVASVLAAPSSIQGIVKDAKGQPIKGADVRIESRDGKKQFNTTKTDANGRYVSGAVPAGTYRVTLVVNGAAKASITNTQTSAGKPTQLNFDLKRTAASPASSTAKSGKHLVWVPNSTGTHIGGSWVEVDDNGSASTGALNVKRGNAEALHQQQMQNSGGPQSVPGGGSSTGP